MASVPHADAGDFDAALACLIPSALDGLASQLACITGFRPAEAQVLLAATRELLLAQLHSMLSRLLVLELNAARVTGQLRAEDSEGRWAEFVARAARPEFWDGLWGPSCPYPDLRVRVQGLIHHRCASAERFARRFARDRSALAGLLGADLGSLEAVAFGAGDSHGGGETVALLRCSAGRLVYKPRSVAVDAALADFIAELQPALAAREGRASSMRVPRVLRGQDDDCGWTEFIAHRHADGPQELGLFYRGIGHWLALMRLLSGSDLHAENLIAHGPHPVVVDCETLFTPKPAPIPSGLGAAADRAAALVGGTVLNIGLLPGRGMGLGWRGVDNSGLGSLPGQQPMLPQPDILQSGSDQAHIGHSLMAAPPAQNLPDASPDLAQYWPQVLQGFESLSALLQTLDLDGTLAAGLRRFEPCRIRVVPRATEVYAELGRMLWHPVSLHQPEPARVRAEELLARAAAHLAMAPNDPAVIAAEVEDLRGGDVPFFSALAGQGRLQGPGGTHWLPAGNWVTAALADWRAADFQLETHCIRAALVSAFINEGWMPAECSLNPAEFSLQDLDRRRRRQAAAILAKLVATAIHGHEASPAGGAVEATVAWIAPVLSPTGWAVQPLEQDLYGGTAGIALLVAAYLAEVSAGRADAVAGLDALLPALVHTLHKAEDKRHAERFKQQARAQKVRPPAPGAYLGLGSQIWAWLMLGELAPRLPAASGIRAGECLERACALAELIPEAAAADDIHDVLSGKAGAIPPLLLLARRSGQQRFAQMAQALGDQLLALAQRRQQDGQELACWTHAQWPEGMGGFAHGASGIAWALRQLAQATGERRFADTAQAAQAFEDALWSEDEGNWLDLRGLEGARTAAAWCHGAVGIGLAALDLDPQIREPGTAERVRRAAAASWRLGTGWNHCACHGDLGVWELLDGAIARGLGPQALGRDELLARLLGSLEQHGPICGIARDVFVPGLLPGLGGVAYQLLRAHPDSALPSILTLRPASA